MSFPEAVRDVAKRYGISIPENDISPEQKQRMDERDQLLTINRTAKDFYRKVLKDAAGEPGRRYLAKRNITPEIVDTFQIGFAPDGWDHLVGFFRNRKIPSELWEKSGLVVPRKNGSGYYDSFRNRLLFPIINISGQVIGFGGRVLDDSLPKYLNSPETHVYNKRRSLYGIDQAKLPAREQESVYIVEGYFDLVTMHMHGIKNSVATLGTSLTGDHVQLLKGLVGKNGRVVLVFDSDAAGIRAAERSIDIFSREFVDAYILVLGGEHDPDSFLSENGADAFREAASRAMSAVAFLIESALKRHGLAPEGKIRIIADLEKIITAIEDPVARSLYIKMLSERIQVDETAVMEKFGGAKTTPHLSGAAARTGHSEKPGDRPSLSTKDTPSDMRMTSNQDRMESMIISMMFGFPGMIDEIRKRHLLEAFHNEPLKRIGMTILDSDGIQPAVVLSRIDDDRLRRLAASLAISEHPWNEAGCLKLLTQFESGLKKENDMQLRNLRASEASKAMKR